MSRTYPYPSPATPPSGAESNAETFPCPLACTHSETLQDLSEHVASVCDAVRTRTRAQYAATGISEYADAACREITDRYAMMLGEALRRQTPDWRNSDGLRGYAASVIRTVPRESMELS